jgi:hypothetical protein
VNTRVVADAVPVNDEGVAYHCSEELEPVRGFGVTDQVVPASTDTALPVLVSSNDFETPFRT